MFVVPLCNVTITSPQLPAATADAETHDERAVESVCSDIITDSLTAAMTLWKQKRAELTSQATPTNDEAQQDMTSSESDKQEIRPATVTAAENDDIVVDEKENEIPAVKAATADGEG